MFTGIVEEIGKVSSMTSNSITIDAETVLCGTNPGDSISVNGICLTVTQIGEQSFTADISKETLNVSAIGKLNHGTFVNLERALPANGRFGGHIVSGHTDGTGIITEIHRQHEFVDLHIRLTEENKKYAVKKGSIAVNGISLTIADIKNNIVKIAVIPHTFNNTSLKFAKIGDLVNIETDILAKYVEKFLSTSDNKSEISMEFLIENGF